MTSKDYERQLNFVEDIITFHPEFLDVLTDKERNAFRNFYQPDWDKVPDYREHYKRVITSDPEAEEQALEALKKILQAGQFNSAGLVI